MINMVFSQKSLTPNVFTGSVPGSTCLAGNTKISFQLRHEIMTQKILMVVQIIFHFHDILRVELEKKMIRPFKKTKQKKQEREREKS